MASPFYDPSVQIPRFLFRGFTKYSGGGEPGLNTTEGITPLGFLSGYDEETAMASDLDPWTLRERANLHCRWLPDAPTPFSSWSHDWRTALRFACSVHYASPAERGHPLEYYGCHIAVLDTWALGDEEMLRNKIFHVPQFGVPGMQIECEWLVWGRVSGPAYRCVPIPAIREAVNCNLWPNHNPRKQPDHYLLLAEARDSMLVAGCFQREDDTSADVMLAVAAAEMASRFFGGQFDTKGSVYDHTDVLRPLAWPRNQVEILLGIFDKCRPVLSGRPLVHGSTALVGFPRARLMNSLLSEVEARCGDTRSDTAWATVDWKKWLRGTWWLGNSCCVCTPVKGGMLGADQPTQAPESHLRSTLTPHRHMR